MLNKHNLQIAKLTTDEATRYNLDCIKVTATETLVTNGRTALRVTKPRSPDEMPEGFAKETEGDFLLDGETALEIAKAIPKKIRGFYQAGNVFVSDLSDGVVTLLTPGLGTSRTYKQEIKGDQFPNVDAVMPEGEPIAEVVVALDLLIPLLKQIRKAQGNDRYPVVLVSIYGEEKQVRFDARNINTQQQICGLLMPVRQGDPSLARDYPVAPKVDDKAK
jgi:hypothetical protein